MLAATSEALGAANDDEYAWGDTGASANVTTRILTIAFESDDPSWQHGLRTRLPRTWPDRVAAVATLDRNEPAAW